MTEAMPNSITDPASILKQLGITPALIATQVHPILAEDVGSGDVTADLIPETSRAEATVISREAAVLCGRPWFDAVFRQLDDDILINWEVDDGERLHAEQTVCRLEGPARALLTGERAALNYLQTLSGTASEARRYADALSGTASRVLDTRKTLPGLRLAQKYAVACGGGANHRIGLFDMVLIKENHIESMGSISAAVAQARRNQPQLPLEVEAETLDQVREALDCGVARILLDNMDIPALKQAVELTAGRAKLEASGNVTIENLREIAETRVDYISVGGLTKHVRAIDFSMRFKHL